MRLRGGVGISKRMRARQLSMPAVYYLALLKSACAFVSVFVFKRLPIQSPQRSAIQQVMSRNSAELGDKGAASASVAAGLSAPKLRTGGYAAWRPDMEVHLARIGAGGAHKRSMEKDHWQALVAKVAAWSDDAVAMALADLGIGSAAGLGASSSSQGSTGSATALTDREEATRKTIRLLVEQSTKAYGAIWSALPEDLRAQASKGGEVPLNFAYGLWAWLERKFQSTTPTACRSGLRAGARRVEATPRPPAYGTPGSRGMGRATRIAPHDGGGRLGA